MGYHVCIGSDEEKVGPIEGIRLGVYLAALLAAVDDGLLSAVYDEGHEKCPHVTFWVTMKGQRALERGRRYG